MLGIIKINEAMIPKLKTPSAKLKIIKKRNIFEM